MWRMVKQMIRSLGLNSVDARRDLMAPSHISCVMYACGLAQASDLRNPKICDALCRCH